MQYDDVGCSSMFQLTHCVSSINSDAASERSSKSGTLHSLASPQPVFNSSTLVLVQTWSLQKQTNNFWNNGGICNGSHLPTGSFGFSCFSKCLNVLASLPFKFVSRWVSEWVILFWLAHLRGFHPCFFICTSSGRATRHRGTSQEGSYSSLRQTGQRTGEKGRVSQFLGSCIGMVRKYYLPAIPTSKNWVT